MNNMLERNITQSINCFEIFTRLEDKINIGEINIYQIFKTEFFKKETYNITLRYNEKFINIVLDVTNCNLSITGSHLVKHYFQTLNDEQFENIKNRFIKIAQKHQNDFEQWIKDTDAFNEFDNN